MESEVKSFKDKLGSGILKSLTDKKNAREKREREMKEKETLSDKTKVADTTWSVIKQFALEKNYRELSWYKSAKIPDEEKQLIEELIQAQ